MKKLIYPTILLSLIFTLNSCKKKNFEKEHIEYPAQVGNNQIVEHNAYTLSYNETHEQADWVAYELTREEAKDTTYARTDDFREDGSVNSISAQLSDYQPTNQTYARGHLAPAADFRWSEQAMSESFFMSNMSPMLHDFNGGAWLSLEKEVRHWADIYDGVYIVTGGILTSGLPTIGSNKVSVPEKFYKIIVDPDQEKGIAFIMPNENITTTFKNYVVSIDEVEEETGIDFFPDLDDKLENKIEERVNMSKWEFKYY